MKHLFTSLFLFGSIACALACDVCGCTFGSMSMGVLPESRASFIGLRYSQARFNARISYNSFYLDDVHSSDTYHTMEAFGRFYFFNRLSLTAIVPYTINQMRGSQNLTISGLADPSVILSANLITPTQSGKLKHGLMIGAGSSVPLGKSDFLDNEQVVNQNFQLGRGSFSFLGSMSYLLRIKNTGLQLESAMSINSTNRQAYRFGNQFNSSLNLFHMIQQQKFALMPTLGAYAELGERHQEDARLVFNTGGQVLFASTGFQLYFGKAVINGTLLLPIAQHFNTDHLTEIESQARWNVGIKYTLD